MRLSDVFATHPRGGGTNVHLSHPKKQDASRQPTGQAGGNGLGDINYAPSLALVEPAAAAAAAAGGGEHFTGGQTLSQSHERFAGGAGQPLSAQRSRLSGNHNHNHNHNHNQSGNHNHNKALGGVSANHNNRNKKGAHANANATNHVAHLPGPTPRAHKKRKKEARTFVRPGTLARYVARARTNPADAAAGSTQHPERLLGRAVASASERRRGTHLAPINVSVVPSTPSMQTPGRGLSTPREQGAGLLALPDDVLMTIVCQLRHTDLEPLRRVCRRLREAAQLARGFHFNYLTPQVTPHAGDVRPTITGDGGLFAANRPSRLGLDVPPAPRRVRRTQARTP
ncbi:F-box domain-containing protein [Pycnococcus provasolii]